MGSPLLRPRGLKAATPLYLLLGSLCPGGLAFPSCGDEHPSTEQLDYWARSAAYVWAL